jgi:NADH-quinone oxidoreductase subunit N
VNFSPDAYLSILPAILMTLFGCSTLLLGVVSKDSREHRHWPVFFNAFGLLFIGYSLFEQWRVVSSPGFTPLTAFQSAITVDGLSVFANSVICLATAILLLTSYRYLELSHEHRHEYYGLALLAQCGMYFMVSASDLVALFVGLELTAISFYILVGFTRTDRRSNEAALKYLLLGALSSGFVLYGFSLLYGLAGSTALADIAASVVRRGAQDPFVLLGVITVTIGLLFKISAVPFHTWAPDAYDGAPTPVTAHLSVASKVASFAVLLRLVWVTLAAARPIWEPVLAAAAVLSLTVGTIAALTQDRLKRLFAYSSIAHAGYILLGFIAGTQSGLHGVYLYLLIYAVMNLGAFAVLTSLRRHNISGEYLSDLRGLSQSHPLHAALFVVLLLSLAGMPPTAGFLAKYFIFVALIQTGHIALAVIAAVYVVVSLYFYFRLVREMYLAPVETREPLAASFGIQLTLLATTALTLVVGLFPEPILRASLPLVGGHQ